ncbi:MAG: hypothetical protein SWJ54_23610 [Cyanobacteriota bacterium]|nr:hypothetical protein [Cyanobacteriota bacterium]
MADAFVQLIQGKDLSLFPPGSFRRFLVPKEEIAYRQATQLDPQDSIILSALMYQYGQGIENQRLPRTKVFSYRFQPDVQLGLYASQNATSFIGNRQIPILILCNPGIITGKCQTLNLEEFSNDA